MITRRRPALLAPVVVLALGLAACQGPGAAGPGPTPRATSAESQYLLISSGGYVRADSPPGIEVTLGTRQVLQIGAALDRQP